MGFIALDFDFAQSVALREKEEKMESFGILLGKDLEMRDFFPNFTASNQFFLALYPQHKDKGNG